MARTRKQTQSKRMKAKTEAPESGNPLFHAFWSGSLTFGLVNVPVLLFPASRHAPVRLRLLGPSGSLLQRRFFCPRDGKEVSRDEIVRGYELDDGSYIVVEDDEIEAIEPQKTREIELRVFVDLAEMPLALLERGYYLAPLKESTKAYRLLAEAMRRTQRAGIATFVMRDHEYLVAIFARDGILCAETLRFADEIRNPETIGLPQPAAPSAARVSLFERSVDALFAKDLSHKELVDKSSRALLAIIDKKKAAGQDLVRIDHKTGGRAPDYASDGDEEDGETDLLETIRRSLRQPASKRASRWHLGKPSQNGSHAKRKGHGRTRR
jgi:DNA end-binding protein Ku